MTPSVPQVVRFLADLEDDPAHATTLDGAPYGIFREAVARGLVEAAEQDAFANVVGKAVGRGLVGFERTQGGSTPPGPVWGDHAFQMHSGYFVTNEGHQLLASIASQGRDPDRPDDRPSAGVGNERAPIRDCFISHAGEDKDAVARPLAEALTAAGYEVWFDEVELVLGDSLREKIDEGLAASRFGVVVLSPKFFEKKWPRSELDALFNKEMVGDERLILPVWHEVDETYIAKRSPLLAGRVGVPSLPLERAVEQIIRAIERQGSPGPAAPKIAAATTPAKPGLADPVRLVETDTRVRLGLTKPEQEQYEREGGHAAGPGWLSVVVGPVTLQRDLVDPTEVALERLRDLRIADQWYATPLNPYLRADHRGFWASLPEGEGAAPAYWMRVWDDGLMEYGTDLARKAGPFNPEPELVVPTTSVAELIHDNTLLFLAMLDEVGYEGEAVALATFSGLGEHFLGIDAARYGWPNTALSVDRVDGRPMRGLVSELPDQVGRWTKKTMDRLFLAAGINGGYGEIDQSGARLDRAGNPI